MLSRNSQELGLNAGAGANVATYQGAAVAPDFKPVQDHGQQALQGLLSLGENISKQVFNQAAEEAYLKGGIAAAQHQSVEDVAKDPYTNAFTRGGFNDENYRIIQAEQTRKFQDWIAQEGHQYAPDDPRTTAALHAASDTLLKSIAPEMSRRSKLDALASQNKVNESLITAHNSAYKKYALEQDVKRKTIGGNQIIAGLSSARANNDGDTYNTISKQVGIYYQGLVNDERIPEDMRKGIASNFLLTVVGEGNDHREVIASLDKAGLLDTLPFDERKKLDSAVHESQQRTLVPDLGNKVADLAHWEQKLRAGDGTDESALAYLRESKKAGINKSWEQAVALFPEKKDGTSGGRSSKDANAIITAYLANRITGPDSVAAYESNGKEAQKLINATMGKQQHSRLDMAKVQVPAALAWGTGIDDYTSESIQQAFTALAATDTKEGINPDHADMVRFITSTYQQTYRADPQKATLILRDLPKETQAAAIRTSEDMAKGIDPVTSLRNQAKEQVEEAKFPLAERVKRQTEIAKAAPVSTLSTNTILGIKWSKDAEVIKVPDTAFNTSQYLPAVTQELRQMELDPQYKYIADKTKLIELAREKVKSRTLFVPLAQGSKEHSLLVLPENNTVESLFGTADKTTVGNLLAERFPPVQEGLQSNLQWDAANHRLVNVQLNADGGLVYMATVDTDALKSEITAMQRAQAYAKQEHQVGHLRKLPNREYLVVDGNNSAGVSKTTAILMRNTLLAANANSPEALPTPTNDEEAGNRILQIAQDGENTPSRNFRESTDLTLRQVSRLPKQYTRSAVITAAIAATAHVEGIDKVQGILEQVSAAQSVNDDTAFNAAVDRVENPVIRERLRQQLKLLPLTY